MREADIPQNSAAFNFIYLFFCFTLLIFGQRKDQFEASWTTQYEISFYFCKKLGLKQFFTLLWTVRKKSFNGNLIN